MKIAKFLVLTAFFALISSCGPQFRTDYSYVAPKTAEGRICTSQCLQTLGYCKENCRLRYDNCIASARVKGENDYRDYVRERRSQGKELKRSKESFFSTSFCETNSCEASCDDTYRLCFGTCGGNVSSRTYCVANCEQK